MGRFLEAEKRRQAEFKIASPYFQDNARADGLFKRNFYPFCLPLNCADQNLFQEIRSAAEDYFAANGIKWHQGQGMHPSNHLCDSQVACANFLFPFASRPGALVELVRPFFPTITEALTVEAGLYVAFEWIGQQNYLGEKVALGGARTRGAHFTSADAAVMFERKDGCRQMVLIEWKYTESYGLTPLHTSKSGTSRTGIYRHLYELDDCPLNKDLLPDVFGAMFYEPFYQLMRQQLLAREMERAHELGADIVTNLHISPAHNFDFHRVTSPTLKTLGNSVIEVWQKLVKPADKFVSIDTEALFSNFPTERFGMDQWWDYVSKRYAWISAGIVNAHTLSHRER